MNIKNAEIKFFKKDGFVSAHNDNMQHIKVLPYLSIVQSIEGSYDIALGNAVTMQTGEGGFFVAPSGIQQTIVHHTNKKSGTMTCRWLFIDVEINKAYRLDSMYRFPTVLKGYYKEKMNDLFDQLFSTDDLWENYSCCYKILGLLLQISELSQNKINPGIQNSVEYIMKNYTQIIKKGKKKYKFFKVLISIVHSNNKKTAETSVPTVIGSVFTYSSIAISGVAGIGLGMCLMSAIKRKKES